MLDRVDTAHAPKKGLATFPREDGSRVPYTVFSSDEIYALEQERIFRGPTWNFLGLEAEIPNPGDYKSTFVGDTPVVMTRAEDGTLAAWVNRCAHRGAMVCRLPRGNALSHTCVYHQWNFGTKGNLQGVPFRRGQKDMTGMPKDFDPSQHSLLHAHSGKQKLRLKPEVDLSSPDIQPFVGLLQMLLSDRRLLDLARNNFRIAAEYEQLLLSLLLAGQPHADAEKERTGGIAPATVRRAESFIRDHASESLTLLSIADAVGVPPRTLLEGFHRFRDKSPMKYLRDVRLDMALQRLIETGTESRIAEIAIECGFGHLSRFARDYMRRFGEKPSQTLAQKKRLVAV